MKSLRPLLAVALSLATAVAFYGFWQYRTLHPATDDAYLKAHIVEVASRVTAPAEFVHVVDNQYVHAGDPLFDLAPATFQARLERARAQLEVAAQDTGASGAQVQAASAALQERQITADHARLTLTRIQTLARRQLLPKQQLDDALATLAQAEAASSTARAELARARNALVKPGCATPNYAPLRPQWHSQNWHFPIPISPRPRMAGSPSSRCARARWWKLASFNSRWLKQASGGWKPIFAKAT